MEERTSPGNFESSVLPHLDAAYNLARWLTRREHDAQDIVQEAYLRAFKAFDQFHGTSGDARCWILTIVRNTCFTWMARNRTAEAAVSFDADAHDRGSGKALSPCACRSAAPASITRRRLRWRSAFSPRCKQRSERPKAHRHGDRSRLVGAGWRLRLRWRLWRSRFGSPFGDRAPQRKS